jgi:parallel beta-helix repeat protein
MRKRIDGHFALEFSFPLVTGLTVSAAIGFSSQAIAADTPPIPLKIVAQSSDANMTRLYVNPLSGNNDRESGNALSPLRTITYALEIAQPNTVILLAPGTYNTDSGETFPLRLKPGVTIQGNPETRGNGIIISGGGEVDRLNVTLVGADGAGLVGVTISNAQGYGVWIDSASPSILNNTFTGNRQDGIAIGGNGSPIVRGNRFIENQASGISVAGTSRADIRENTFEGADVGLAIAESAIPLVMSNQIANNADGVVVRQNAQPILRGNVITKNDRYGVVVRDRAQPNLGTADDPGGNTIRENEDRDIENASAQQVVQAFGNELDRDRTQGQVDFSGGAQPVLVSARSADSIPASDVPVRDFGQVLSARATIASQTPSDPPPSPIQATTRTLSALPTLPETSLNPVSSGSPLPKPPATLAALPSASPFLPPPALSLEQPLSVSERVPSVGVLPVPDVDIPLGDAGDESFISLQPPSEISQSSRSSANLRYRVIVEAHSVRERAAIRAIAPDAFSTFINGQEVVQAGAFREFDRATSLVEQLQGLGLVATIEDMDQSSNN